MSVSLKSLGIDRLGVEERIALVEEIWDSIAADSAAVPLTTPQRDELDRRLADHAARRDFEDAAVWYEERRSGLSAEFRAEVDAAVALAAEQPLRFPRKHKDIRCVRVRRFPYSVFFLQEESRIVVLAVFHVRRDPRQWQSRA
jgi:putative addiction module component (TIGR02574 family)